MGARRFRGDPEPAPEGLLGVGQADGALEGGADFGTSGAGGVHGGALSFDGVDDAVQLPGLDLQSNTVTVTAWIRREGAQPEWAGLFFSRAGGTTAGLNFGTGQELRYHWDGGMWGWDSGLVVPDATWTFVALVVEPTHIVGIYSRPVAAVVVIAYAAAIVGGEMQPTPEALDVRAFEIEDIPWDGLGFNNTLWAVRDWVRSVRPDMDVVVLGEEHADR